MYFKRFSTWCAIIVFTSSFSISTLDSNASGNLEKGAGPADIPSSFQVIDRGSDGNSGWVAFNVEFSTGDSKEKIYETVEHPGGGRWIYGSYLTDNDKTKVCYSRYLHPQVTHGSTAYLAYKKDEKGVLKKRDTKGPGEESDAWLAGVSSKTCYAFWNKA